MRALVTRPDPGGGATMAALQRLGIDAVQAPLLAPRWLDPGLPEPGEIDALVLTSANALRGLMDLPGAEGFFERPVFAVGDATANAARDAGFTQVESAAGAFADLVALLSIRLARGRLLYPRARETSGDLAAALDADRFTLSERVVYAMESVDGLPPEIARMLEGGQIDMVLHYSRRSARAFVAASRAFPGLVRDRTMLCLAAQVAEPLAEAGFTDLRIADAPNEEAMLHLASSFAKEEKPA